MSLLTVYCAQSSPRLQYVLDWLLGEVLGTGYQLVHTEEPVGEERFFISYGRKLPGALTIPDAGLLWEQEIHDVRAEVGNWKGLPVLFARPGDHSLSFDLFSAIFYLISR